MLGNPLAAVDTIGLGHERIRRRACQKDGHAGQVRRPGHATDRHRRAHHALLLADRAVLEPRELSIDAVPMLSIHDAGRSEEHTSELQSLMRISYAVFCLKKKK